MHEPFESAKVNTATVRACSRALWLGALLAYALVALGWPHARTAWGQPGAPPATVSDLGALQHAFQEVVERVSPSVVAIRARRQTTATVPADDGSAGAGTAEQLVTLNGSGTIIRADGSILTNQHLVQGCADVEVILADGHTLVARIVAADARSDLAILRVAAEGLKPARFCAWERVARGQWSLALGNPYGLGSDGRLSVSVGVVSNLGRALPGLGEVDDRLYADMIQTTAPIHPGNSGGPLFNIDGELIGVVTALHTRSADDEGLGFAIPLNPARRRIIDQLLDGRAIEHGYLGLTVRALEPRERQAAGLPPGPGVLVEQVEPDGPAATAGVRVGDIVTHHDEAPIETAVELADRVGQTRVGNPSTLKLRRGRETLEVRVTVAGRQVNRVGWMRSGAVLWRGMRVADLTPDARQHAPAPAGALGIVVVDVRAGSPAERARLHAGDVIEAVEGQEVRDALRFLDSVRNRPGVVRLRLHGRGEVSVSP